jgi:hypothetical protein
MEIDLGDKIYFNHSGNFGAEGGEGQGFSRRRKKIAKIPRGYKFEQNSLGPPIKKAPVKRKNFSYARKRVFL